MQKKIKTERFIWIDIMITLLALELMAFFYYGARALVLGGICIAVSLAAEIISLRLMKKKFTADNLSCTSDALITALMLPAVIRYEIPALACVFAVIAAKNIFGGRHNMIFSPAAAAYVFMLTSWEKELLYYSEPHVKAELWGQASDLVRSASHTLNTTGKIAETDFEILLGNLSGPMGAASILLLIVSAVVLIFRRDISAGAFAGTVFGTGFLAYFCPIAESGAESVKYVFATNMILFAAIYIISDRRLAPKRNYYAFFYGLFIAIVSYVLMLTTGQENVIVILSLLFTPLSLALKNLEKSIEMAEETEKSEKEAVIAAENERCEDTELTSAFMLSSDEDLTYEESKEEIAKAESEAAEGDEGDEQ